MFSRARGGLGELRQDASDLPLTGFLVREVQSGFADECPLLEPSNMQPLGAANDANPPVFVVMLKGDR